MSIPSKTDLAAVLIYALTLAAVVAMELSGHNSTIILTVAGPVIAATWITEHVSSATAEQNEKLEATKAAAQKAAEQTNGVLDQRIAQGVALALGELNPAPPPGCPATWPPRPAIVDADPRTDPPV